MKNLGCNMEKDKMGKFDRYHVENAARTIQEAEEFKKDSELMTEVRKILKKKIASLEDLKRLAQTSSEENEMEEGD